MYLIRSFCGPNFFVPVIYPCGRKKRRLCFANKHRYIFPNTIIYLHKNVIYYTVKDEIFVGIKFHCLQKLLVSLELIFMNGNLFSTFKLESKHSLFILLDKLLVKLNAQLTFSTLAVFCTFLILFYFPTHSVFVSQQ